MNPNGRRSSPQLNLTARRAALELARKDASLCASDVAELAHCASVTAQVALCKLAAEKLLVRVARGQYARPGLFPEHTSTRPGPTTMARGLNEAANRALEAADAWLRDTPKLPAARPLVFDAPRSRHGGGR